MSKQIVYRNGAGKSYKDIKPSEEPIPEIDKHEVLIKIKAVALNFRDIVAADGRYPFPIKKNYVPCSDGAGEVVKLGLQFEIYKSEIELLPHLILRTFTVLQKIG